MWVASLVPFFGLLWMIVSITPPVLCGVVGGLLGYCWGMALMSFLPGWDYVSEEDVL